MLLRIDTDLYIDPDDVEAVEVNLTDEGEPVTEISTKWDHVYTTKQGIEMVVKAIDNARTNLDQGSG